MLTLIAMLGVAATVHSNPIYYEVNFDYGTGLYEYEYTVDNQTIEPIEEFTIWFDLGLYDTLSITGNPSLDWDGIAAQPDPSLPDDGYADWLIYGEAISVGSALSGFSVSFDWLGIGTPGSQFFEIVDPITFDVLSSGDTQPLQSSAPVPEPSTMLLIGVGLAFIVGREKKKLVHP